MAIIFVNAGAEGSAASGNITLGAPASPQIDDVWIAVVHSSDQVAHTFTDWTQIFQANGGGTTSRLSVWYFRYAGSTPNLIVTHTGGQSPIGGILSFRGCIKIGSLVDTTGAGGAGTDASIEISGITPTANDCMLVACDGSADDNTRSPLPTGFAAGLEDAGGGTQNCYITTAGNPDGSVAGHYKIHTSGATGNFTDTQAAADAWASVLIALRPLHTQAVSGALTFSGGPNLKSLLGLSGVVNFAGNLNFKTLISFGGSLVTSGVVSTVVFFTQAVSGALTLAGTLGIRVFLGLIGNITPSGVVNQKTRINLAGVLSSLAVVTVKVGIRLSGALSFSGLVNLKTSIQQAGTLNFVGALNQKIMLGLGGILGTAAGLAVKTRLTLTGVLSSTGNLVTQLFGGGATFFQSVGGMLTFLGNLATAISGSGNYGFHYRDDDPQSPHFKLGGEAIRNNTEYDTSKFPSPE